MCWEARSLPPTSLEPAALVAQGLCHMWSFWIMTSHTLPAPRTLLTSHLWHSVSYGKAFWVCKIQGYVSVLFVLLKDSSRVALWLDFLKTGLFNVHKPHGWFSQCEEVLNGRVLSEGLCGESLLLFSCFTSWLYSSDPIWFHNMVPFQTFFPWRT